jgi:MoxR-like ATPase
VFHYIEFPSQELMRQIVDVHFPKIEDELLAQVLLKFYWLREQPDVRKKPSTSELVDWLSALQRAGLSQDMVRNSFPFLGVLLKKEADLKAIQKRV